MADDKNLPKQELLLKMLKMTTSDNDGTALVAIRKANTLLEQFGWDWDKLIAGKIRVVENPFAKVADPRKPAPVERHHQARTAAQQSIPPRPAHAPGIGMMWQFNQSAWTWESVNDPYYKSPRKPPPKPQPKQSYFKGLGLTKPNVYAGHCYCCGDYVANQAGFVMQPTSFNPSAQTGNKSGWAVCCKPCDTSRTPDSFGVPTRAAMRNTGQTTAQGPSPSLNNL